jgi:hypothetical protein
MFRASVDIKDAQSLKTEEEKRKQRSHQNHQRLTVAKHHYR